MYNNDTFIKFIIFWINYYRYIDKKDNEEKISKAIAFFTKNIFENEKFSSNIYKKIKKLENVANRVLFERITIADCKFCFDNITENVKIQFLCVSPFTNFNLFFLCFEQIKRDSFNFKNLLLSYKSDIYEETEDNKKTFKFIYDFFQNSIQECQKYEIVYFYSAILEIDCKNIEEGKLKPINEMLLVNKKTYFEIIEEWSSTSFYIQVLLKLKAK